MSSNTEVKQQVENSSLEAELTNVLSEFIQNGTVEKLISQHVEKGINNALDNLFRSYGDITKLIEEKIKSVMIPYLENYNYDEYIVKLDSVLVEILENTAMDNKKILENFKSMMLPIEGKTMKLSELFEKWTEHVAKNVETDGLDIDYDDEPSYEYVEVTMEVEKSEDRSWSSFEHAIVNFECEHDEKMNFQLRISHYKDGRDKTWNISYDRTPDIKSLRHLNDFEILLMKMDQQHITLELDTDFEREDVRPKKEPEVTLS